MYAVKVAISWKSSGLLNCSVLFFRCPWSDGWPHHGWTFSIYLCPLPFWLILPRGVLSMFWCCLSRLCVVFLTCVYLALFLALSLSVGSFVTIVCKLFLALAVSNSSLFTPTLLRTYSFVFCPQSLQNLSQSFHLKGVKTIFCSDAPISCPLFNVLRNFVIHSPSSVIRNPRYENVSTCSSCSFWMKTRHAMPSLAITLVLLTLMSRLYLQLTRSRRSTNSCSSASEVAHRMMSSAWRSSWSFVLQLLNYSKLFSNAILHTVLWQLIRF